MWHDQRQTPITSSAYPRLHELRAAGGTPYPIPAGASDHRLGGLRFANWADELQRQEAELGMFFDTIIVCSVTGSTARPPSILCCLAR
jgi:1-aminocyclopropane-1-carboxylate deaminase/D-cysteine desulfhydrase-like pyridoxal-dependent ACC family enzyme